MWSYLSVQWEGFLVVNLRCGFSEEVVTGRSNHLYFVGQCIASRAYGGLQGYFHIHRGYHHPLLAGVLWHCFCRSITMLLGYYLLLAENQDGEALSLWKCSRLHWLCWTPIHFDLLQYMFLRAYAVPLGYNILGNLMVTKCAVIFT